MSSSKGSKPSKGRPFTYTGRSRKVVELAACVFIGYLALMLTYRQLADVFVKASQVAIIFGIATAGICWVFPGGAVASAVSRRWESLKQRHAASDADDQVTS